LASGLVFFAGGGTTGIAKNAAIDCTMSVWAFAMPGFEGGRTALFLWWWTWQWL
jgi:hypothetical protein